MLTNGLKLADMDYCRGLVETKAHILLSWDGSNPQTYAVLRNSRPAMEKKRAAIENLARIDRVKRRKVILIMCVARNLNDDEIGDYLAFCHRYRDILSAVYLMPLAHTWESKESDFRPERITTEDVEALVDAAFDAEQVDFLPAGFLASLGRLGGAIGAGELPFRDAHPNCESVCLLVSDGDRYCPLSRYLRRSLRDLAGDLKEFDEKLAGREAQLCSSAPGRALSALRLRGPLLRLLAGAGLLRMLVREVRLADMLKGRGIGKLWHALALSARLAMDGSRHAALQRHAHVQGFLQVVVLPFEDDYVLETERIERCPNAHAFLEPDSGEVNYVPICAWRLHNQKVLRALADSWARTRTRPASRAPSDLT